MNITEKIIIDPTGAQLVVMDSEDIENPLSRKSVVPIKTFVRNLMYSPQSKDFVIPKNCRYMEKIGRHTLFVVEDSPAIRSVLLDMNFEADIEGLRLTGKLEEYGYQNFLNDHKYPYRLSLSFPYIIYFIVLDENNQFYNMKLFFRLHPFNTLEDYLLRPCLTNINDSCGVCLGGVADSKGYIHSISKAIDSFWFNSFNRDYTHNYTMYSKVDEVCNYLTWAYFTKYDPMFIFSVKWIEYDSVGNILETVRNSLIRKDGGGNVDIDNFNLVKSSMLNHRSGTQIQKFTYSEGLFSTHGAISIGDTVEYKDERCCISSIIYKSGIQGPVVELMDKDKKEILVSADQSIIDTFAKYVNRCKELDILKFDDYEIKVGDIVSITREDYDRMLIRKVEKIRESLDGKIELKLGDTYYLHNDKTSKMIRPLNKLLKDGIELEKGKRYILKDSNRITYSDLTHCGHLAIYDSIEIAGTSSPTLKFRYSETSDRFSRYFDDNSFQVQNFDDYRLLDTYRLGNKIFTNTTDYNRLYDSKSNIVMISKNGKYPTEIFSGYSSYQINLTYDVTAAISSIVKRDRIELGSFDLDISFSKGDRVVVADWDNPHEMTVVREITGFEVDDKNILQVKTISLNKSEELSVPYIDFNSKHPVGGKINIGKIRKISSEFMGIKSGTRMVSKKSFQNFLKKDVVEVIGFLTDTGTIPLMLFSNLCTVWCNEEDLNNFQILSSNTKKKVTVDDPKKLIKSIKFQFGDLVELPGGNVGILVKHRNLKYQFGVVDCSKVSQHHPERKLENMNSCKHFGFITPRYHAKTQVSFPYFNVVPNMHGWQTVINHINSCSIPIEERILNYVPNSNK